MKKPMLFFGLLLCIWQGCDQITGQARSGYPDAGVKLAGSIPLPGVKGRIDHLAFNSRKQIIYVAALGNNTIEVVDLKNKKVIQTIKGLEEPQGIAFIRKYNIIVVANGASGACNIFDADSYRLISSVALDGDADNVRYDSLAELIFIGYGNGGIACIDAKTRASVAAIKLPGHPESFQMDHFGKKMYVNVPDAHTIEVLNLETNSVAGSWKMKEAAANFPMALDEVNHRLFIGCRQPAKLLVINAETGKTTASAEGDNDTDDIFYDRRGNQVLMTCGAGYIDVFKQLGPDQYTAAARIKTLPGARTSLLLPERDQLIVAAPARTGQEAQLLIYDIHY